MPGDDANEAKREGDKSQEPSGEEGKAKKIGFSLGKAKKPIKKKSVLKEEEKEVKEEKVLVTGFDSGKALSNEKSSGPVVIPLTEEQFIIPDHLKKKKPAFVPGGAGAEAREFETVSKEDLALGANIQYGLNTKEPNPANATQAAIDRWKDADDKPLLLKNRLPLLDEVEDEKEKFRIDMECRPVEPSLEDYQNVPVNLFGEAMLRGMGWEPGAPVGLSNPAVVEPVTFKKRNDRLGLGATAMIPKADIRKLDGSSDRKRKRDDKEGADGDRKERRRDKDRDRDRDRDGERHRDRDRDRDRDRGRDRNRDRDRDRDRDRERHRDRDRDRERHRDRDRDRYRDRDRRDRERDRDRDRDRGKDRGGDRYR